MVHLHSHTVFTLLIIVSAGRLLPATGFTLSYFQDLSPRLNPYLDADITNMTLAIMRYQINTLGANITLETYFASTQTEVSQMQWQMNEAYANDPERATVTSTSQQTARMLPMIDSSITAYFAASPELTNAEMFLENSWVSLMMPSFSLHAQIYLEMMTYFGWTYIFIVHHDKPLSASISDALQQMDAEGTLHLGGGYVWDVDLDDEANGDNMVAAVDESGTTILAMLLLDQEKFMPLMTHMRATDHIIGHAYFSIYDINYFNWTVGLCDLAQGFLVPKPLMRDGFLEEVDARLRSTASLGTGWTTEDQANLDLINGKLHDVVDMLAYAADMITVYAKAIDETMSDSSFVFSSESIVRAVRGVNVASSESLSNEIRFDSSTGERLQNWGVYNVRCNATGAYDSTSLCVATWYHADGDLVVNESAIAEMALPGCDEGDSKYPLDRNRFKLAMSFSTYGQMCAYERSIDDLTKDLEARPLSTTHTKIKFVPVYLPFSRLSNTTDPKCEATKVAAGTCAVSGAIPKTYQASPRAPL